MAVGPDAGVMSGRVIINIRNCRETKGPKWKGLAGWGDLTMSCTSVIFLVRLELSQGFNWNPDFKETPQPIQATPPSPSARQPLPLPYPPLSHPHPCTGSPGWIHSCPLRQPRARRLWPRQYHREHRHAQPPAEIDFAAVCRSGCLGVLHLSSVARMPTTLF